MTISVIVPTLNEEAGIGALLEELSRQPGLEVIVSDGGSTDRTGEICRSRGAVFIVGPPCRGRQLNAGAEIAAGEILLFLHADSSPEGRIFDDIRGAVGRGNCWGCCTFSFDEDGLFFRILAAVCRCRVIFSSICYGDQGIYCTRELFRQMGGFPDLPLFEDRVFSGRMRRIGRAFVVRGRITTSARRFRERGRWSMLWKSQLLKLLFFLGVSPHRLSAMYKTAGCARTAGDANRAESARTEEDAQAARSAGIAGYAQTAGSARLAGGAEACQRQP